MAIEALSNITRAGVGAFAAGGAGASLNVGSAAVSVTPAAMWEATASVSDAAITPASKVWAWLAPNSDWDADELAGYAVVATPAAGSITLALSGPGPIGGTFQVHYLWS